jgi:hypothetical protein
MSFGEWQKNGWLKEHRSSEEEITNLLEIVDRDLAAAATLELVSEWRFNIAYNAILQLATASLAASGYQAARNAHHYRVLQSLALTLGLPTSDIAVLDSFRKKRNAADYERAEVVSDSEVEEIISIAKKLRGDVTKWLRRQYPELVA